MIIIIFFGDFMSEFYYALSFVSRDSKGIVAETTRILFENGFNIADSSSTLLQGVFAMIFIVTSDKNYEENEIKSIFANEGIQMEAFKYENKVPEKDEIHYSISVYGADKPGIVHKITADIAAHGLNILDLQTKVTGKENKVYIMILEAAAKSDANESEWQTDLKKTASLINTQINIEKIDIYEL